MPEGDLELRILGFQNRGEADGALHFVIATSVRGLGAREIVLLGHSFGGAVVINASTLSNAVRGVVAMSSQLYRAHVADRLSPRPVTCSWHA
jgi:triacylglycerol esterase/lipase EstA (alpha/beta hydrolase family)